LDNAANSHVLFEKPVLMIEAMRMQLPINIGISLARIDDDKGF